MIFVLVMAFYNALHTQEFNSQAACEKAMVTISREFTPTRTPSMLCIPKG